MKKQILTLFIASIMIVSIGVISAVTDCTFTNIGTTMTLDADCTTDATISVTDGFTLDGNGYTITAVDPSGGHFLGAVIKNAGATAYVTNLGVATNGLANVCDGGDNRLRGIMFEGASGSITNSVVNDINQGLSGCQEGNAIEVRNAPFDGTHPGTVTVEVSHNTINNYQKTGVVANGDVDVNVNHNTITGLGPVNYIAQNGIQLGFFSKGEVTDNVVSGNYYTGEFWSSAGLLFYSVYPKEITKRHNILDGNQAGQLTANANAAWI